MTTLCSTSSMRLYVRWIHCDSDSGDCHPDVEVIRTNNAEMTGMVASMQVSHYGNTGFGTKDLLCMLLSEVC